MYAFSLWDQMAGMSQSIIFQYINSIENSKIGLDIAKAISKMDNLEEFELRW